MNPKRTTSGIFKLALCFMFPLALFAQQSKLASLEAQLQGYKEQDTTKVTLLLKLANSYTVIDAKKAYDYAKQGNHLSDSIGYTNGKITSMRFMAWYFTTQFDYETASSIALEALEMSERHNYTEEIIKNLIFIGTIQLRRNDYHRGIESYLKALKLAEEINDKKAINTLLRNIGAGHAKLKDYENALQYTERGLALAREIGRKSDQSRALANIAEMHRELNQLDKALGTIQESIALAREVNLAYLLEHSLINSGNINAELGNYTIATAHYEEGIQISKKTNNNHFICEGNLGLARIAFYNGNLDKSKKLSHIALNIANANNFTQFTIDTHLLLSDIESAMGNHKSAFMHHKSHKLLSDSLVNEDRIKKVTLLENKYAFENEKELLKAEEERKEVLQKAEIARQAQLRKLATGAAVVFLVLGLIILYNLQRKRLSNKQLALQKAEIEAQNNLLVELDSFKQTMTGSIVNDLKEGLNEIINPNGSNNAHEHMLKTKQTGVTMLNMVLNILDVHKHEKLKLKPKMQGYQLLAIADEAIDGTVKLAREKRISIDNAIEADMGISCERELIRRAFANLLDNAIKYCPKEGHIRTFAITNNDMVQIKIEGDGTIDDRPLEQLFDKYPKGDIQAVNLALAFCKMAVEAHGGTIMVEDKKELGKTTYTFTLKGTANFEVEKTNSWHVATTAIKKITLGKADKKMLRPYLEALAQVTVYEITKFKEIIANLKVDGGPIAEWKQNLEQSVVQLNEENYRQLINLEVEK